MSLCSAKEIRILMLHGYTQSGRSFEIKLQPLIKRLISILSAHYGTQENNIQLIFPNAPIPLDPYTTSDYESTIESSIYGWTAFYSADEKVPYEGLERSLSFLSFTTKIQGPFSGVVGFSQGAALAAIFASWCESDFTPKRRQAIQDMRTKLDTTFSQLLSLPPQGPLDFAIFYSGFTATMEFYYGFYNPPLTTPSIHILGKLDTFIPKVNSLELLESCRCSVLIEYEGVHYVPRDKATVEKVIQNLSILLQRQRNFISRHGPRNEPTSAPYSGPSTPLSTGKKSNNSRHVKKEKIIRRYRFSRLF